MKAFWFSCGTIVGLTTLSITLASVPNRVTDDTAIYQHLSEINVPHQGHLNFDSDIAKLTAEEASYRENLPRLSDRPSLRGPMKRIAHKKYHANSTPKRRWAEE